MSGEDELISPLKGDPSEDEEEEVEVKSKVKDGVMSVEVTDDTVPLESHIDTPPNGAIPSQPTPLQRTLTLEAADDDPRANSEYRLWDSTGEFGLSGPFKIGGKKRILMLEDDMLQWYQKGKEREKETLSLADIITIVPHPSRGQRSQEATRFIVHGLQTQPGTCGKLVDLVCQPDDPHPVVTTQNWVNHLNHQIQNFGNRPRRLYVVINPHCGNSSGQMVWDKVQNLFAMANVNTEAFVTQRRFHAREVMQTLDLAQYDGVVIVGGDGTINEVINGLMLQAQQTAGVNLRRSRFVPVQPNIRVGFIPAGFSNSIAWSVLGTRCPVTAAAQILLGCVSSMDVSSLSHNGQLLLFSGGALTYGLMSEVSVFSRDFTWLKDRRIDVAQLRAVLYSREFEAEVSYIPSKDNRSILSTRTKCYAGCSKCTDTDNPLGSTTMNEKGASVMATYTNVDRVPDQEWRRISGVFSTVIACPLSCRSQQAFNGISPWAHQGDGCIDLLMVRQASKLDIIKWLIRQRRSSETSFELPFVQIQRVKEFKFREILTPPTRAEEEETLVANGEDDDDDVTNRRGASLRHQQSRDQTITPTSHWNVDGDDLNRAEIDVRIHRHMLQVFSRGVEPPPPMSPLPSNRTGHAHNEHTDPVNDEVPTLPSNTSNSSSNALTELDPSISDKSSQYLIGTPS